MAAADRARQHPAAVQPQAQPHPRLIVPREGGVQRLDPGPDSPGGRQGGAGIRLPPLAEGSAKHRQQPVAGEFVDQSAPGLDRLHHGLQHPVHPLQQGLRWQVFRQPHEAGDVGHKNRDEQAAAGKTIPRQQAAAPRPQLPRHNGRDGLAQ